ncbi:MAG: hypothetical protein AAGH68_04180 [Pseudomonadota bacterium]
MPLHSTRPGEAVTIKRTDDAAHNAEADAAANHFDTGALAAMGYERTAQ